MCYANAQSQLRVDTTYTSMKKEDFLKMDSLVVKDSTVSLVRGYLFYLTGCDSNHW